MMQINNQPIDQDTEIRRALAKVYALLIKLAKEVEKMPSEVQQKDDVSAPLKKNIPAGQ